jgi:hypothetical protein
LEDVRAALDSLDVTQAAWMGFFACIVFLRHAYRYVISAHKASVYY